VCYIVDNYCLMFHEGVCIVVVCYIVDKYCLRFHEGVCLVVVCYIVDNYCLRFTERVCLVVVCYYTLLRETLNSNYQQYNTQQQDTLFR
jgi:hypothetical protein